MRFLFYTHSLVSDWNHGNAHFLRGVMRALQACGHETLALEPDDSWSRANLIADRGRNAIAAFTQAFPDLNWQVYDDAFDHEAALDKSDVVIVHEWTGRDLIARVARAREAGGRFLLFFHDTHHRSVSARDDIAALVLEGYDGVLAFGETLRERYLEAGWGRQVFTWHEAADITIFRPHPEIAQERDLVWIGNWGDGERSDELERFLIAPAERLGLEATVYGVRYPDHARDRLREAGIGFGGSIANTEVPKAFARHRLTVHVPRRPYVEALRGIPTIRPFEALACGIPLISAPWEDLEELFAPGDILFVRTGEEMEDCMRTLIGDPAAQAEQARRGRESILARHTCGHRAEELLTIVAEIRGHVPDLQEVQA
jgi:spore maturation protein CgeB